MNTEPDFFKLHKVANSLEKIPFINNNTYYNNFNIVNNFQTISDKDAKDLLLKEHYFKKYGSSTNFDSTSFKKNIEFIVNPIKTSMKETANVDYKFYPSNANSKANYAGKADTFDKKTKTSRIPDKKQGNQFMTSSASVETLGGGYYILEKGVNSGKQVTSNANMIQFTKRVIDIVRKPLKTDEKIIEDIEDYDEGMVKQVHTESNASRRLVKNTNLFGSVELPSSKNTYYNKLINSNNQFKKVTLNTLRDQLQTYSNDSKPSVNYKLSSNSKTNSKIEVISQSPYEKKISQQFKDNKIINSKPKDMKTTNYKIASIKYIYNTSGKKTTDKLIITKTFQ